MGKQFGYYIDLHKIELAEGQKETWLHAMPVGNVKHPIYGEIKFDQESLTGYANSVKNRVLGTVDPVIDYDHMMFNGKAAGWVKDARVQFEGKLDDGLHLKVEWTDEAAQQIRNKQYRYFSPTFDDEWEDPQGNKHKYVIFGGGITNRPYLKNLLPLNLSELTFSDPPTPPNPPAPKENDVDPKILAQVLGLSENVTEAELVAKLAEVVAKANAAPAAPATPPAPEPTPVLELSDAVRQLAETNPAVKALTQHMELLARQNAENRKKLIEAAVDARLAEFDRGNLILTPAAKEAVKELAMSLNETQSKQFWELLKAMRDNNNFFVELGERGSALVEPGRGQLSATEIFNQRVQKLLSDNPNMQLADAYDQVCREDRDLYDRYRRETFIAG